MYPVLTTDSLLQTLGLGTLSDAISCEVEEERNGSYELTLEYPQGGAHADDIALNALIVAKPNFTDNPQPFRIYSITKEISGKIEVHAQHISYDLGGVVVSPTTMTGATCKQAGDYLLTGTPFTFQTDKTNSANFAVDVPSSARSWLGGKSGSLLSVYGSGEYHYDGYNVVFNAQRGTNRGVELRYGKNLTELKSEADCSNLASSVVCYYEENGTVTSGTAVSTGLVGITRELAIDVSDDYNTAPSVATLTARATQYIADHNLTAPKTNITLDFVQASKLKDRVDLCDTVSIYYEALGVSAVTKCIRTVWDVLAERYTETEFGDAKTNIADTIVEVEQVAAESVTKTIMQQAIDSATSQITGNNGGYVVLHDANNDGFPDELLIMDTPDISTAVKLWRYNASGLGYSSTGYSGTYGLAITQNGAIVADFITAGTLNANVIRAGILQDALGKNSWNLDTGAFTITDGSINITTNSETYDVIALAYNNWASSMSAGGFSASSNNDGWNTSVNGGAIYFKHTSVNPNLDVLELSFGAIRFRSEATSKLQQLAYANQIEQYDYNGDLRQKIGIVTPYDTGSVKQYDSSGTVLQELSGDGKLLEYDSSGTLRQQLDGNGKLWQYDANGKQRTYLEYGDIYLYTSAEKNTLRLSSGGYASVLNTSGKTAASMGVYNDQHGYVYLYDGTSNTLRSWYDYTGLKFANASGTQIAGLTTSALTFYNSSGTKLNDFASYSVDNWIAGPPSPMVLSRTGIKVYRMGTFAIFTMEIYVTSGFTAGTWFPLCNICDNVGSLKGDFNAQIPDETGTSSFLLNIRGSDGEVSIYRYATSGNITGWLRACVPIMFEG